jgi:hypothetical protein
MKRIRIGFSNMWGGNDSAFTSDYIYRTFPFLRNEYDIEVYLGEADFMLYSVYDYIKKPAPNSVRILISGECGDHFAEGGKIAPGEYDKDFFHYGLTMAWDNPHPNHCYLPLSYIMLNLYNNGWKSLIRNKEHYYYKEHFCDFIYSNPNSMVRREFCAKLQQYKRVECAGVVDRNTNALANLSSYDESGYISKQRFQSTCKFSIAFENNYFPGYTSEKLSDPFVARSVPIYSGNPNVGQLFNPRAMINVDSFRSHKEAIEYIKHVDQHDYVYEAMLDEPPFVGNVVPKSVGDEFYLEFFKRIFG